MGCISEQINKCDIPTEFRYELAQLINKYSVETTSNTPDFILADYLISCLEVFAVTSDLRESWFGKKLEIKN